MKTKSLSCSVESTKEDNNFVFKYSFEKTLKVFRVRVDLPGIFALPGGRGSSTTMITTGRFKIRKDPNTISAVFVTALSCSITLP